MKMLLLICSLVLVFLATSCSHCCKKQHSGCHQDKSCCQKKEGCADGKCDLKKENCDKCEQCKEKCDNCEKCKTGDCSGGVCKKATDATPVAAPADAAKKKK